jgi:hypothetical protein
MSDLRRHRSSQKINSLLSVRSLEISRSVSGCGLFRRQPPRKSGTDSFFLNCEDLMKRDRTDAFQRGTLFGAEIWEYLLEKWGRICAYRDQEGLPLEAEHIVPKVCGGSNRVSNLTVSCRRCNQRKGSQPVHVFWKTIRPGWLAFSAKRRKRYRVRQR